LRKRPKRTTKSLPDVITGILRVHPRGFGFVQPTHSAEYPKEIFIPKHCIGGGVDGDTVEVAVDPNSNWERGPEGKVVEIIQRGRTHLAGIVHYAESKGNYLIYAPLLGTSKPISVRSKKVWNVGDRVVVKISDWGTEEEETRGEIERFIGSIADPSLDIPAAIEEYDLPKEFSKAATDQAKAWGSSVSPRDMKGREDVTSLVTITIDPETAKDFDDALSLTKDSNGYHLGVHIADVAHYVPAGSPLDEEATRRCNSTYFPGFCLPMLPHELSSELCSLRPDVIRLTASVFMDFDLDGHLQQYRIARTAIKSSKRFTYEEAKEVLDGKKKSPFAPLLHEMVDLCGLLKKRRSERGSIDFALADLVISVDEHGVPRGTHTVEYDITHQLVEEFMLKANEVVARHLAGKEKPVVFRIHEEPSPDNIEEFYTLARTLGFPLSGKPTTKELQELFAKAKETPFGKQLSVGFIRSMKLACYSEANVGHFGLALEYYCHFTSPIRRYIDLTIQRLLFEEQGPDTDVPKIALRCSERERVSFRAETSVKVLKKIRLLDAWRTEDPHATYDAVVTKVRPFGLAFEVEALALEGFLHISELENDYFLFHPQQGTLVGRSSGMVHRVGEALKVRVATTDLILLETKWELAAGRRRSQKPSPRRGGRRGKR
jgi:ribonuclease R